MHAAVYAAAAFAAAPSVVEHPAPQPLTLTPAQRVCHRADGRHGFVVSRPEALGYRTALVRVAVEGSTRYELWPLHLVDLLPPRQQHRAMGGQYDAPAGYPLCI
jgi:hypothetical protein